MNTKAATAKTVRKFRRPLEVQVVRVKAVTKWEWSHGSEIIGAALRYYEGAERRELLDRASQLVAWN